MTPAAPAAREQIRDMPDGVQRITRPLPFALDHVHCYLLERADGSFTVVDAGLDANSVEEDWSPVLARLSGPVEAVVVTHYHPDHIGAAAALAALTGARVLQGRLDRHQSLQAWDDELAPSRESAHLRRHGMPAEGAEAVEHRQRSLASRITLAGAVDYLEPGDDVGGWEVLQLPGHADGHLSLQRGDVLIAGDAILAPITPNVGLHPESRPDPLGRYLRSLRSLLTMGPHIALAGHGDPIRDIAHRAAEIIAHHAARLAEAERLLDGRHASAYEVSLGLFPASLPPAVRHFAVCETLAHLERLALEDRAERFEDGSRVVFAPTG